jgi:hypothetical protein
MFCSGGGRDDHYATILVVGLIGFLFFFNSRVARCVFEKSPKMWPNPFIDKKIYVSVTVEKVDKLCVLLP